MDKKSAVIGLTLALGLVTIATFSLKHSMVSTLSCMEKLHPFVC